MPAPTGPQFTQLKLFTTPKEIMDQGYGGVTSDEFIRARHGGFEGLDEMWSRKAREADSSGLTADIKTKGVEVPVALGTDVQPRFDEGVDPSLGPIISGYHRVAAANAVDPNMIIPITYRSRSEQSMIDKYGDEDSGVTTTAHRGEWDEL
jgi:hypothetical protein